MGAAYDEAVDTVFDTLDMLEARLADRRWLMGAALTEPDLRLFPTLARFDVAYPEPQANFTWWIGDTYAGNFGPHRALRLNPFRTYQERGIRWAGGSDYPVTPFPARFGIWASMARKTLLGVYGDNPYGTAESVDVRTALRSFTMWAAHQMFLEDKAGSIEVGKYADLAVWDRDFYSVDPAGIPDMKCEMTLFQGKVVHDVMGSR